MTPPRFLNNERPTLGIEVELQLVDARTMALRSAIAEVLDALPAELHASVKPELLQCCLEVTTEVCRDVAEAERDLARKIRLAEEAAHRVGVRLFWAGTHPFSPWHDQLVTPKPRYLELVELMQQTARRLATCGLHVHVGVDSGDKAIMVCDRIMNHLPTLLALSANSPFWNGRATGLHSQRIKVMEGLPTAGLPPLMRNWSEYLWLIDHMVQTGFIRTTREIWWDVRPHMQYGTVEVRICDMPPDLPSVLALTALIQCLVVDLSREVERGTYQYACHPTLVRQNKWRACRYGMGAELVDPYTHEPRSARRVVESLVDRLGGIAEELGCGGYLARAREMAGQPTGSARQVELAEATGDLAEVVRRMVEESHLGAEA
jgi:glutamate---cysteine ligase / carboxylate-amine ligase